MFPATALGAELIRAVPAPDDVGPVRARLRHALGDGGADREVALAGRLPLAALADYGPASRFGDGRETAARAGLTGAQAVLAEHVERRTAGMLWCLVSGPIRGAAGADEPAAGQVAAGQVVWLATDQGWVGLRPDPDPDGSRMVALEPADRTDLGAWIAPYVAQILEAAA
jgi:hypothetical protein